MAKKPEKKINRKKGYAKNRSRQPEMSKLEAVGSIRTIELRRQIALKVDPLRKIMRIACGQRVKGMRRKPTEEQIIHANYRLLDKFLPDLKAMELSENPDAPFGGSKAALVAELMKHLGDDEPDNDIPER